MLNRSTDYLKSYNACDIEELERCLSAGTIAVELPRIPAGNLERPVCLADCLGHSKTVIGIVQNCSQAGQELLHLHL